MARMHDIRHLLGRIYGERAGRTAFHRIEPLLAGNAVPLAEKRPLFSERDIILITYGDSIRSRQAAPLATLKAFADHYLKDVFTTIHVLPFFPYSSDDGFSVKDFMEVDPDLGTWADIERLGEHFKLMFDLVLNHISAKSTWFRNYLDETPGYTELAIEVDPAADLSRVVRPRSLPLLTPFEKRSGRTAHVWTTFSPDQVDLNYKSLEVLARMISVLLLYARKGAAVLRLDAIAYLWKELGTPCIHLRQTHDMVKLFRKILDLAFPHVLLLTETNVPHQENVSYFGNGLDEAQAVYNFTLPPLLLHAFHAKDATVLSKWARGLEKHSEFTTFLNFTASHDGIGVRPLEGILPSSAIDRLLTICTQNGGRISLKKNHDNTQSPYELNITYIDALGRPGDTESDLTKRFLASQAIQLALPGIPAIYLNTLLGSRNWEAGVRRTRRARTINREKFTEGELTAQLQAESFRREIFFQYLHMIRIRKAQSAFHPNASFEVLDIHPSIFALKRFCKAQTLLALINVSASPQTFKAGNAITPPMKDLITGTVYDIDQIRLNPGQFVWLSD